MDDLSALPAFLTSLGVGLMMGLERELRAGTNAGLRTFCLVGVAGTAAAMVSAQAGSPWLLPAAALGLIAMMIAADHHRGDLSEQNEKNKPHGASSERPRIPEREAQRVDAWVGLRLATIR